MKQIIILQHLINKNNLSIPEYIDTSRLKSPITMFTLSCVLGVLGVDRFILKDIKLGIFKLFVLMTPIIFSFYHSNYYVNDPYSTDSYQIIITIWFLCSCIKVFWIYDMLSIKRRTQEYNFKTILNMFFQNKNSFSDQSTIHNLDNEYVNNDSKCILNKNAYFNSKDLSFLKQMGTDKNSSDYDKDLLKNPIKMFFTSLFLGLFGIDRFLLKQSVSGKIKLTTFILIAILFLVIYFILEWNYMGLDLMAFLIACFICPVCLGYLFMFWLLDLCTTIHRTKYHNFMIACDGLMHSQDNINLTQSQISESRD